MTRTTSWFRFTCNMFVKTVCRHRHGRRQRVCVLSCSVAPSMLSLGWIINWYQCAHSAVQQALQCVGIFIHLWVLLVVVTSILKHQLNVINQCLLAWILCIRTLPLKTATMDTDSRSLKYVAAIHTKELPFNTIYSVCALGMHQISASSPANPKSRYFVQIWPSQAPAKFAAGFAGFFVHCVLAIDS